MWWDPPNKWYVRYVFANFMMEQNIILHFLYYYHHFTVYRLEIRERVLK